MTYLEAIEALKPITEHDVYEDHFKDACILACQAMKKVMEYEETVKHALDVAGEMFGKD